MKGGESQLKAKSSLTSLSNIKALGRELPVNWCLMMAISARDTVARHKKMSINMIFLANNPKSLRN
jgi:hypothetical protein